MIDLEKYVLDRFEEDIAVLEKEDGSVETIKKDLLGNAKEGDVIIFSNGNYCVDIAETEKRKALISEKAKIVFKNN